MFSERRSERHVPSLSSVSPCAWALTRGRVSSSEPRDQHPLAVPLPQPHWDPETVLWVIVRWSCLSPPEDLCAGQLPPGVTPGLRLGVGQGPAATAQPALEGGLGGGAGGLPKELTSE